MPDTMQFHFTRLKCAEIIVMATCLSTKSLNDHNKPIVLQTSSINLTMSFDYAVVRHNDAS